jgi:DNA-binding MarR family transcriptional regulator
VFTVCVGTASSSRPETRRRSRLADTEELDVDGSTAKSDAPRTIPPDVIEMAAWRGFLEAYRRVIDVLETELRAETGMPLAWYDVLVHLSEAEHGALRMRRLADAILLSRSGLTRLVDRMEAAGLVERRACAGDARGIEAVLTPAGFQRLRETAPVHLRGVHEHFSGQLDAAEKAVLAAALPRLARQVPQGT